MHCISVHPSTERSTHCTNPLPPQRLWCIRRRMQEEESPWRHPQPEQQPSLLLVGGLVFHNHKRPNKAQHPPTRSMRTPHTANNPVLHQALQLSTGTVLSSHLPLSTVGTVRALRRRCPPPPPPPPPHVGMLKRRKLTWKMHMCTAVCNIQANTRREEGAGGGGL